MRASPTHRVVAWSKTTVAMAVQGQGSGSGGAILHGDRSGGGVGRQLHAEGQEQDR
jgi:hypothetical protein